MSWSPSYEFRFGFSREGITYYVQLLILLNTGIYALQLIADIPLGNAFVNDPPGGTEILRYLAYSNGHLLQGWVWTLLTYMFVHASLSHVFFNMLMLFFFGPDVERVLGTRQFIRFYLLCGVLGALANLVPGLLFRQPDLPVIGASGAILAVLVAFAMIDPDRQLFLIPLPFPITARALVIFLIAINLLGAIRGGPAAVTTHFGGMIAGYAYMKLRPRWLQWSWQRRGRRVRKRKKDGDDEEKLAEAIDNIFKFQDRDRR